MKLTDGKVIYRSKLFPKLVATDFMVSQFNQRYPVLKGKMREEFRKMEMWLLTHPERQPKRNWARFIAAWMRNANEFMLHPRRPGVQQGRAQGDAGFSKTNKGEPISLDEFLGKLAAGTKI